jgi:hypothetical protein
MPLITVDFFQEAGHLPTVEILSKDQEIKFCNVATS